MPFFNYKVRDKFGLLIKGKIEAATKEQADQALRSLNHTIIQISPLAEWEIAWMQFLQKCKRTSSKEILSFTRQMASMIHAGLPILTSLNNIIQQTDNIHLKKVLGQISQDIEGGSSFAAAVEKHPKFFSKFFVSMISVGEISGRLDEVLNRLVAIGKQENEIRAKLINAMTYPFILLSLLLLVLLFLFIGVLPKFITVYNSLGVDLPLPTRVLLNVSSVLQKFWWLLFALLGTGIYSFHRYRKTSQGLFNSDRLFLKVPLFGSIILKYNLARFSRTLGSLLKSGISVLQGLAVTENTITNHVLKVIIKDLRSSILEGQSLSEQLKLSGIFPPMIIQMIYAGEQTGKLDEMLLDVADFYDVEVDYEIKNLTTFIEPLLLVVMAGFVLFIALAILKPIFNLTQVIR